MALYPKLPDRGPIPAPGPLSMFPPAPPAVRTAAFTRPTADGAGHPTLDALMMRQKELAEQQAAMSQGSPQNNTILGGIGSMFSQYFTGLNRHKAEQQEIEGNKAVTSTLSQIDPATGGTSEQLAAIGEWNPELMTKLWADRSARAKQETYGPVITGEAAKNLGLDPAKSYQLNQTSGQYDQVGGGGGVTVNTGSDKLTEGLGSAITYYTGARNADFDLSQGNLDQALSEVPNLAADYITGGYVGSDQYKRAKTAATAWAMNVLRDESGAALGKEEIAGQLSTYFPVAGDGPEQVAYKRKLRENRTKTWRYILENSAPETLKKMDADFATYSGAAAAPAPAPDPANPNPPPAPDPANPNPKPAEQPATAGSDLTDMDDADLISGKFKPKVGDFIRADGGKRRIYNGGPPLEDSSWVLEQ